ncbi:hypothetical protein VULLAG_LOCUS20189 [Vulpes lagopus]
MQVILKTGHPTGRNVQFGWDLDGTGNLAGETNTGTPLEQDPHSLGPDQTPVTLLQDDGGTESQSKERHDLEWESLCLPSCQSSSAPITGTYPPN